MFLKSLGPHALNELLEVYKLSFLHGDCLKIWRIATIIPRLKSEKLASEVASFRPVSLTSRIAKLMERIIANRLYHIAETSICSASYRRGSGRAGAVRITLPGSSRRL